MGYEEDLKQDIAKYTRQIEENPNDAEAYNNRGIAYYCLEEYEPAIQDFAKAIELNPNNSESYFNRGLAYDDLEKYYQAIQDYDMSIQLNPNIYYVYFHRGWCYYLLKQYELSLKDYDKALELNPDDFWTKNELFLSRLRPRWQNSIEENACLYSHYLAGVIIDLSDFESGSSLLFLLILETANFYDVIASGQGIQFQNSVFVGLRMLGRIQISIVCEIL